MTTTKTFPIDIDTYNRLTEANRALRDALALAQVRVFMVDGYSELYQQITTALDLAERKEPQR